MQQHVEYLNVSYPNHDMVYLNGLCEVVIIQPSKLQIKLDNVNTWNKSNKRKKLLK